MNIKTIEEARELIGKTVWCDLTVVDKRVPYCYLRVIDEVTEITVDEYHVAVLLKKHQRWVLIDKVHVMEHSEI